jgi:prenyltransferase beta subunit
MPTLDDVVISLSKLVPIYDDLQKGLITEIESITSQDKMSPGEFLKIQLQTGIVATLYDTISNLLATVVSMVTVSVRNQRAS